jgi:NAD+ synthase
VKNNLRLTESDLELCRKKIAESIRKIVEDSNSSGVVLGLSGGVDSALVLKLAVDSGVDVLALIMPEEGITSQGDVDDAVSLAKSAGVKYSIIKLNPVISAIEKTFPWKDYPDENKRCAFGNSKARVRMIMNYLAANCGRRIVLGTGNRTEILLGYSTKYGDGGVDIQPIGGLFKTHVRQLAAHMSVPEKIVNKVPTAGLWVGQTDEGEVGASYDDMDKIYFSLVVEGLSVDKTAKNVGVDKSLVEKLVRRMESNRHKGAAPKNVKLFD